MKYAILAALIFAGCAHAPPQPEFIGGELGESHAQGPSTPSALALAPAPRPVSSRPLHGPLLPGGAGDPAPAATRDANNPEPTTLSPPDPMPYDPNANAGVYAPGLVVGPSGAQPVTTPAQTAPTTAAPNGPGTGNAPIAQPAPAPSSPQPAPVGPGTGNAPIAPR